MRCSFNIFFILCCEKRGEGGLAKSIAKSLAQHSRARRYLYICAFSMVNIHVISPCRRVLRQLAGITVKRFLPSVSKPGIDFTKVSQVRMYPEHCFLTIVFCIGAILMRHLDLKVTFFYPAMHSTFSEHSYKKYVILHNVPVRSVSSPER